MRISPAFFAFLSPIVAFLASGVIWVFILSQTIRFCFGLLIFTFFLFLVIFNGFMINRRAGALFRLKTRRNILSVSLVAAVCFAEIFWAISFLPFPFYILAGLFAAVFFVSFDIIKSYFGQRSGLFAESELVEFKKILYRDITVFVIFTILLLAMSAWLPRR